MLLEENQQVNTKPCHHTSGLQSLWNLCMAYPHMMDMLVCAYPTLWNIKIKSSNSLRPSKDITFPQNPQLDTAFKKSSDVPSKNQKKAKQFRTSMDAKRTTHVWEYNESTLVDAINTTEISTNVPDDMNKGSTRLMSTVGVVTSVFNEDTRKMRPFRSSPADANSRRQFFHDLELESNTNLLSDHLHHLYQKVDEDDMSIHSSDFLMALDGIHVDQPEDTLESNMGTVIIDVMKLRN
jgi:hypothetical protein